MNNKYLKNILILSILAVISSCNLKESVEKPKTTYQSDGVYRYSCGEKDGFKIWIVDGAKVRREIFNEYLYGGNPERYTFVPDDEIWIDNSISAEEYETTLAHELNERNLMAKLGMTYFDAHDSSLQLEQKMRKEYFQECSMHERELEPVSPIDFDSTREITALPGKIKLKNIYRVPYGERDGVKIWIVDGFAVRRDIYPDFGLSGNDMAYHFIPNGEIWIDNDASCEETEYSIALETKERELIKQGYSYDNAYLEAIKISDFMRKDELKLCSEHAQLKIIEPLFRDTGTGKENIR
jgi:hypothetical protein